MKIETIGKVAAGLAVGASLSGPVRLMKELMFALVQILKIAKLRLRLVHRKKVL